MAPDFTREAMEFVGSLSHLRGQVLVHLQVSSAKYKAVADRHRLDLQFALLITYEPF